MSLLTSTNAAEELGISVHTLYDWLSQSDAGKFFLQGENVTIDYFQTGARGQGRIRIEESEVRRLLDLMKARPKKANTPKPRRANSLSHITTKLGRPDD